MQFMTASIARRELSTFVNRPFGWVPIPNHTGMFWCWEAGEYTLTCLQDGVFTLWYGPIGGANGIRFHDSQGVQMAIDFIKQVKAWRRDNQCM